MRVNTRTVLEAWEQHKSAHPSDSIWTDGERIMSYGTCIVERVGDYVCFNPTRYSTTTTAHQNSLRSEIDAFLSADNLPRGTGHLI